MTGSIRVADYLMNAVAAAGVKHVFLLPGGGAMHLVDALGQQPGLEYIPNHHEQACAIAAEAYGRITENIGVALVTTGPGATNTITGVTGAWIESTPMMVISGQVKRADLLGNSGLRQKGVQEVDVVSLVAPVTKYAVTVTDPTEIRFHMEKALHLARTGRQGPVWLDIPLDVQASMIDPDKLQLFSAPTGRSPDDQKLQLDSQAAEVLRLLGEAKRPLILAGHGIRLGGAARNFRALVDALDVPVAFTWNAMDLLPEAHPLNVGKPGVVALRGPNFALQNCDLLIAIGCRLDPVITAYNLKGFARSAHKVVVDIDAAELDKHTATEKLTPICADAGDFISALLKTCTAQALPGCAAWQDKCRQWKHRYPVLDGKAFPSEGPIGHYQLADALSAAIPENMIVATGSSGLGIEAFYTVFRNKPGQRVFLTSGLGAMGYGLPAAIGACFANNRNKMVLIESDGSLQLNIQELATIRGFDLPIIIFILNNGGYASIRNTQRNYFQGRYVATGKEAKLSLPDTCSIARAYGLPTMRIDNASNLAKGLREALAQSGPFVCEIMLTPDETLWPKVAAMPQADGSMMSMPMEDMSPLLQLEQLKQEMLIPLAEASIKARK